MVLEPEKDCSNCKNINNPKARDIIIEYMAINNVTDPFRELCLKLKQYTRRKWNPLQQTRLDFFLISEGMFQNIQQSKTGLSY